MIPSAAPEGSPILLGVCHVLESLPSMPVRCPSSTVPRRDFFAAVAAIPLLAALDPRRAAGDEAARSLPDREVDVVIIGAGLSGLAAARDLRKAGRSVVVLEARDRV